MSRRALLIASATGGLTGPATDLRLMTEAVTGHDFTVRALSGKEASRAGILGAYEELIEETEADDAALVYYSGHGGIVCDEDTAARGGRRYRQFLVPTDIDASSPTDFRGVLDVELSNLLARLTRRSANVTVVLDCCHSAQASRTDGDRVRGLERVWRQGLDHHLHMLRKEGEDRFTHAMGNESAVKLVACGRHQSAYEYTDRVHGPVGYMTLALYRALIHDRMRGVSWKTLGEWVRGLVMLKQPNQRPDLEGAVMRRLFVLEEDHLPDVLALFPGSEGMWLSGGRLHGVCMRDVYSLQSATVTADSPNLELGTARVVEVTAGRARVVTEPGLLPAGLRAFPRRRHLQPYPVRSTGSDYIARAIEASIYLREGSVDETTARVDTIAGNHMLMNEEGLQMGAATRDTGAVLEALTAMARARALREIEGGEGAAALVEDRDFTIEWGTVDDRGPLARPRGGELLARGDAVFLYLANTLDHDSLFINLFNIGIDARIGSMTASRALSGVEVRPGEDLTLGYDPETGRCPWQLYWPAAIPRDVPRLDHLIAIISDAPQDMSTLIHPGTRLRDAERASPLEQTIAMIGGGSTRNLGMEEDVDAVRYAVTKISFALDPS